MRLTRHRVWMASSVSIVWAIGACPGQHENRYDFDGDGYEDTIDCAPEDDEIYPGAPDPHGDLVDNNCDGVDGVDADGDGYPGNAAENHADHDCNDGDVDIHPAAVEGCDAVDNDCDGATDEDFDADGDGTTTCGDDGMTGTSDDDCDDGDASISPGHTEYCNDETDNDCDGEVDENCSGYEHDVPGTEDTIQEALDAASPGDRIAVHAGYYLENLDFPDFDVELIGIDGREATTVDGGGANSVISIVGSQGRDTVVTGLTLINGDALMGGGLYLDGASPTLRDLVLGDNVAEDGGGIYMTSSSPLLTDVLLADNVASDHGGGLYAVVGSSPEIEFTRFERNHCGDRGGAVALDSGSTSLNNVILLDNTALQGGAIRAKGQVSMDIRQTLMAGNEATWGAAMYLHTQCVATLTNVAIVDNTALEHGGALALYSGSDTDMENVSLVGNEAGLYGGGIYGDIEGSTTLRNVDFSDNKASGSGGGIYSDQGAYTAAFCNFFANVPDDVAGSSPDLEDFNLQSDDPMYQDTVSSDSLHWDLHLGTGSSLVDAGDPTVVDGDGSRSDVGVFGGNAGQQFDLDHDGHESWWQPGPYEASYAPYGWDCDDLDPDVFPGQGC